MKIQCVILARICNKYVLKMALSRKFNLFLSLSLSLKGLSIHLKLMDQDERIKCYFFECMCVYSILAKNQ